MEGLNDMNILFVFFQFLPNIGGTEIPMYHYARELVRRGHHVTVYTANACGFKPSKLRPEEVIDGIAVKRFKVIPLPTRYNYLTFFTPSIVPALMSVGADLVQVFSLLPSFITTVSCLIAKIRKIPLILYPQYHPSRLNIFTSFMKKALFRFFDKVIGVYILKMADYIIALTDAEATLYKQQGMKNVRLIYEGITIQKPPAAAEISSFREKYSLSDDQVFLLTVGRIEKRKGIEFLIRSIPKVLERFPNIRLIIVGEDNGYLSRLEKLAHELNCDEHIVFTGAVSDFELSSAYALSSIVIVPSQFEAYGRVVVEGWSFRKPIVASKNVALAAELVSKDNGVLVKFGDSEALADAIIGLLYHPGHAETLGANGYEIAKELTWEKRVDALEEVYDFIKSKTGFTP